MDSFNLSYDKPKCFRRLHKPALSGLGLGVHSIASRLPLASGCCPLSVFVLVAWEPDDFCLMDDLRELVLDTIIGGVDGRTLANSLSVDSIIIDKVDIMRRVTKYSTVLYQ